MVDYYVSLAVMAGIGVLYVIGWKQRRNFIKHQRTFKCAIIADVLLTLFIEFRYSVAPSLLGWERYIIEHRWVLVSHIIVSMLLICVCYPMIWWNGTLLLRKRTAALQAPGPQWATALEAPLKLFRLIGCFEWWLLGLVLPQSAAGHAALRARHLALAYTTVVMFVLTFISVPGWILEWCIHG